MTSWITQTAKVVARSEGWVQVQPVTTQGCQTCQLAGACGQGVLARWMQKKRPTIQLAAPDSVAVGDLIELGVSSEALIRAALWQYLLPLVAALFSLLLVDGLFAPPLAFQAGAALLGLLVGLVIAERYAARVELKLMPSPSSSARTSFP